MITINENGFVSEILKWIKEILSAIYWKLVKVCRWCKHFLFPVNFKNWVENGQAMISFGSDYFDLTYLGMKISCEDKNFYSLLKNSKLSKTNFCIFKNYPLKGHIGIISEDNNFRKCSKIHIEIKYKIFLVTRIFKKDVLFEDFFCK